MIDIPSEQHLGSPTDLSVGLIPDLSSARLYFAVLTETVDDPRLLTLWAAYSMWASIDAATGRQPDTATWASRTRLVEETVVELTEVLIKRRLLTRSHRIPWSELQDASTQAVRSYTNDLRARAGIKQQPSQQATLFDRGHDREFGR